MTSQTRSEVMDDMAAVCEQVRKTTEATSEQARQTIGAAQEQLQQNLSKVQQAQGDIARAMLRWNEQNCLLVNTAFAGFWDASLSMVKLATWGQEQAERTVLQAVEQTRLAREEGTRLVHEFAERARHHQAELCRIGQESMRTSLFYAGKGVRREGEPAR